MKSSTQRKRPHTVARPAYRSLDGWALGTLIDQGAVTECEHHGHRRDRSDPHALDRAREEARHSPFPGTSAEQSVDAVNQVMTALGDTCPDCD